MPNLPRRCSESQPSSPQPLTSTSTLSDCSSLLSTIEPAVIRDLQESVALTVNDKNLLSDDINPPSESNVLIECDVNIDKKMPSVLFVIRN